MTFTVNYVGGGTSTFTQSFSDWKNGYTGAGTTAPGESIAEHMTSYDNSTGNTSGNVYLYGYVFSTTSSSVISSIQFPNNIKVKILAIDEINAAQQADPEDGVIEGAAVVTATQPVGSREPTRNSPAVSTSFAYYGVSLSGDELISVALDEIAPTAARAPGVEVVALASGSLWAGQPGNETSGSSAAGAMLGTPGALLALRSRLLRRIAL